MDILSSLLLLFEIFGANAASGIYHKKNQVYVISDNSPYLYCYDMKSSETTKVLLDSGFTSEVAEKKDKLDLEAMCQVGPELLMLGSGSKANREQAYFYHLKSGKVERLSLTVLYEELRRVATLDKADFNIEAVAYKRGNWYFLNRGNGPKNKNVVFSFKGGRNLQAVPQRIHVRMYELPTIGGTVAGFSDGLILGNKLYYSATAEDKASTYLDGEVKGSYMGYIDLSSWSLGPIQEISTNKKVEGITLLKKSPKARTFMLCDDPDNKALISSKVYAFDFTEK